MWPDLPMPLTMTRPLQARISETAARKRSSRRAISARTASASMASTLRASSRAEAVASFGIMTGEYSPAKKKGRLAPAFRSPRTVLRLQRAAEQVNVGAVFHVSRGGLLSRRRIGRRLQLAAHGARDRYSVIHLRVGSNGDLVGQVARAHDQPGKAA